jgi:hypothetical protein
MIGFPASLAAGDTARPVHNSRFLHSGAGLLEPEAERAVQACAAIPF